MGNYKVYTITGADNGNKWRFRATPVEHAPVVIEPATAEVETDLWAAMRAGLHVVLIGDEVCGKLKVTAVRVVE